MKLEEKPKKELEYSDIFWMILTDPDTWLNSRVIISVVIIIVCLLVTCLASF